MHGNAGMVSSG